MGIMGTSNSPSHTLSRLIHGDYFDRYPYLIPKFEGKVFNHIMKCKHTKCMRIKNRL